MNLWVIVSIFTPMKISLIITTYNRKEFLKRALNSVFQGSLLPDEMIVIDPGIGFGKSVEDNFKIIHHLNEFLSLGYPLLIGVSRKSFIGKTLDAAENKRIFGTAAAVTSSVLGGAHIIRVHDVRREKIGGRTCGNSHNCQQNMIVAYLHTIKVHPVRQGNRKPK